jgi:antitoxin component YwqK of YwqJK toxin-antitoxin module
MIRYIFFLAVCFVSCQGVKTKVEVDPDTGFKTTFSIDPKDQTYDGPYSKVDSAGVLLEKGNYTKGQLEGIRELYFPDGKVKVRERYSKGQISDLYEYFFPNGKLELQGEYINGAMYGIWRKYNEDGKLLEEVMMVENEEMGPFTEYYPDGTIQTKGTYLHGPNEDGILNLYDESGQLHKTMLCDSGTCVTTWEKK